MRMTRALTVIGLAGLAMLSQGCMRMATESMEATMGAKGTYYQGTPLGPDKDHMALQEYKRFELGEVKNSAGKFLPPEFLVYFPRQFNKVMGKSHLPADPSGKTLLIRVNVIHYEKANTVDNVFGPFEEVVARVELVDKDSSRVLGEGAVIGRTTQSAGLGPEAKAEGLARGLVKWLSDYYPKPPKD
jgi:hypothetical protein